MSHKETSLSDQTTPLSANDEATPSPTNQVVTLLSAPQTPLAMTSPQTRQPCGWYAIPAELLRMILEKIDAKAIFRLMRTCKFFLQVMLRPSSWIAFIPKYKLPQLPTGINGDKPPILYKRKFCPSMAVVQFPFEIPLEVSWNRVYFMGFSLPHEEDPRDRFYFVECFKRILSDDGFFNIELLRALCLPKLCSKEEAQYDSINPISKNAFWEVNRYCLQRPCEVSENAGIVSSEYIGSEGTRRLAYQAASDADMSRIMLRRSLNTLSVVFIALLGHFPRLRRFSPPQMTANGFTKICQGMLNLRLHYVDPPSLPRITEPANHKFFMNLKVLHLDIRLKLDFLIELPSTLGELDVHGCRMEEGDYCPFVCLYANDCPNLKLV
jgi:hypothetical protein